MAKSILSLLVGTLVRTTKAIEWHGLKIPKDALGTITSVGMKGKSVIVKFRATKYGSLELWAKEVRLA